MVAAEPVRPDLELKHKIFFTTRPPPETAARIGGLADRLSAEGYLSGRRTPPARLHVSLNYIGVYPAAPRDLVDFVCRIASTIRTPSFVLAFNRVMSFGGGNGARPLVLGGHESVIGADMLHERIHAALIAGGLRGRLAPFAPHLTLSREDGPRAERIIEPIAWRVSEFRLVDGVHGEGRHEVLGRWSLDG